MNSKDAYAPTLAERHASEVAAGWDRLDSGRKLLAQQKARELDENEARSLAQIRAETERSLANQAVALRDAERAAELAAIERRNTDMEAAREARNREAQDIMARDAASARKDADREAEIAALERKNATELALATRQTRLKAEREAHVVHTDSRRARFSAAWATLRAISPIKAGIVALVRIAVCWSQMPFRSVGPTSSGAISSRGVSGLPDTNATNPSRVARARSMSSISRVDCVCARSLRCLAS